MRRGVTVLVVAFLLVSLVPGPAVAAEDPRFEVYVSEPELQPGQQQTVSIQLVNDAEDVDDRVTKATNVRVTAKQGPTPIRVVSGSQFLGTMQDGVPESVAIQVEVPTDATGGTYQLPLTVSYEYDGDEREQDTVHATVRIPERPIFAVESVDSTVHLRETGTVSVSMTNIGSMSANETTLEIASMNPALTIGGAQTVTKFLGEWEPGATKQLTLPVTATEGAVSEEYAFQIRPTYRNEQDVLREAPIASIGVSPVAETRFAVERVSEQVAPGETGQLEMTLRNRGDAELDDATVHLESGTSAITFGSQPASTEFVGTWAPGESKTITATVTAAEGTGSGLEAIQATVSFTHPTGVAARSGPYDVGMGVAPERFTVESVSDDVVLGETGPLEVTLRNRGEAKLEGATVHLESGTPAITFEGQSASTEFVGNWSPGETRTITADVTATDAAQARTQSVQATVTFEHSTGVRTQSGPYDVGVTVSPEQTFSYSDVSVDLRESSGVLQATVTNDGERAVENAVVTLETLGPMVQVTEPTDPVGTLGPGDSATVSFEFGVSPEAQPGIRQFTAQVQYDRGDSATYQSDGTALRVILPIDEDVFVLEPENATFGIDTTNELTVQIRNTGDETLTDIQARLAAIPPYESQSPSSYVASLEPGESAILTFEVTTPEDAVPTRDALRVNVSAKTETEKTIRAGPYVVPIQIAEAGGTTDNTTAIAVGAVVVIVFLGASWWWLNR